MKASEGIEDRLIELEKLLAKKPEEAFEIANSMLSNESVLNDIQFTSKIKEILSRCFLKLNSNERALNYALEALDYFEANNDYANAALCLNTIGGVYNFIGDHEKRLKCNLKCLKYRKKGGDELGELGTLNNIGDTYIQLGNYEKALEYFNLCLDIPYLDLHTKTIVKNNIGETYFFKGELEKAIPFFEEAILLSKQSDYKIIDAVANVFLAKIFIQKTELDHALKKLEDALVIVLEVKYSTEELEIYKLFTSIYHQKGDVELAYQFQSKFVKLKEKLDKENNLRLIHDLQFSYHVDQLEKETQKQKEQNRQLRSAYQKISQQNSLIEEKNKSITDSINYAKRIQTALLPSSDEIKNHFSESFVLNQPRDIVSGDFYWVSDLPKHIIIAVADCTGHGVPGALMSMIGINILNQLVNDQNVTKPSQALELLDKKIYSSLNKSSSDFYYSDGMDIAICAISKEDFSFTYAGANRPILIVRDNQLIEFKPTKFAIGGLYNRDKTFKDNASELKSGDQIYLFTDGYADQFGGDKGKKFKYKNLKELILKNSSQPMKEQLAILQQTFKNWKGNLEQIDDVCILGLKL